MIGVNNLAIADNYNIVRCVVKNYPLLKAKTLDIAMTVEETMDLPVRAAAKLLGVSVGTVAGRRKRLKDKELKIDNSDDWDKKLFEPYAVRKARKLREISNR